MDIFNNDNYKIIDTEENLAPTEPLNALYNITHPDNKTKIDNKTFTQMIKKCKEFHIGTVGITNLATIREYMKNKEGK